MSTSELFLLAMVVIFTVPFLFWRLLRTDHWAPLVVVQIVGGIVLGPGMLGAVFPAAYAAVFAPPVVQALNGVAWWAVILFVFVAGLELDARAAWADRRETAVTAGLALGVPLLFGCAAAGVLLRWDAGPQLAGSAGAPWQVLLGIGMSCAVTALPILVLFLEKLEVFGTAFGQRVLRYASLDDVLIWGVLAVILLDAARIGRQVAFLLCFAFAAWAVRRLMARLSAEDRWYAGLIWLLATALAADWAGLHFMVGAFLAGAVLDVGWFARERLTAFRNAVLLALMPVFFLSTGLRTQWGGAGWAVVAAAALLLVASVLGKLIGVAIAGRLNGWRRGEAAVIGWLLQTKALITIIFASILLDREVIAAPAFTALLLMAVGSTMLTIPVVTRLRARATEPAGAAATERALGRLPRSDGRNE